ncbi:MAG: VOC family protein [Methanobrevibacter sp.]|jgi:lactoylglutathione lyase|nr:VOC family protein [Candidatus Methanovirga procula]
MKIKYSTVMVKDMDESIRFYTEVMDFKVDSSFDIINGKITLLKGDGDTLLELIHNKEKKNMLPRQKVNMPDQSEHKTGLFSVGMEVEDLKATVDELKSKGVEFILEPTKISVGQMALFKDPNGAKIVLIHHD